MTGRRNGLLKQTARVPHADCCKSPSERAVGSGRGRTAVTGRRNGLLKQTARIPGADCFRSPSERAVGVGRGRTSITARSDELLKQMAPHTTENMIVEFAALKIVLSSQSYHGYKLVCNAFENEYFKAPVTHALQPVGDCIATKKQLQPMQPLCDQKLRFSVADQSATGRRQLSLKIGDPSAIA